MQRSVSELEAATGEKKGGGDVSGVRTQIALIVHTVVSKKLHAVVSCEEEETNFH